jgi:hypothetical protein
MSNSSGLLITALKASTNNILHSLKINLHYFKIIAKINIPYFFIFILSGLQLPQNIAHPSLLLLLWRDEKHGFGVSYSDITVVPTSVAMWELVV